MSLRVLMSGGGTGGHIYPALAIADALRAQRPEAEFLFVGAIGKMEMHRVPAAGYDIVGLPVSALHRKLDARNLGFPFKLTASLLKAWRTVGEFEPDVAVGTGGFASGPALASAAARGVPVFVQEQNAYPGATNRLLGRVATQVFTAYTAAHAYFASAKTCRTGNPLRSTLSRAALVPAAEALSAFGLDPAKPTVLSFGGSLGSLAINRAHAELHDFYAANPQLQLIWQTGEGYYERYRESPTAQLPNVHCTRYLDRMALAYSAASLVMCRAGALSIAELQLLGKPAVLVPSPNVAGDHQTANARAVAEGGGAVVVTDRELVPRLPVLLPELLTDPARLGRLATSIGAQAMPGAAETIATHILRHVS